MNSLFQLHRLNEVGMARAKAMAEQFDALLTWVESQPLGPGREIALCRTHLEEACFYAKKALAQNAENQVTNG